MGSAVADTIIWGSVITITRAKPATKDGLVIPFLNIAENNNRPRQR
jgi:hypothetical protein